MHMYTIIFLNSFLGQTSKSDPLLDFDIHESFSLLQTILLYNEGKDIVRQNFAKQMFCSIRIFFDKEKCFMNEIENSENNSYEANALRLLSNFTSRNNKNKLFFCSADCSEIVKCTFTVFLNSVGEPQKLASYIFRSLLARTSPSRCRFFILSLFPKVRRFFYNYSPIVILLHNIIMYFKRNLR